MASDDYGEEEALRAAVCEAEIATRALAEQTTGRDRAAVRIAGARLVKAIVNIARTTGADPHRPPRTALPVQSTAWLLAHASGAAVGIAYAHLDANTHTPKSRRRLARAIDATSQAVGVLTTFARPPTPDPRQLAMPHLAETP